MSNLEIEPIKSNCIYVQTPEVAGATVLNIMQLFEIEGDRSLVGETLFDQVYVQDFDNFRSRRDLREI